MLIFNKIRWKNLLSTGNQFIEVNFTQSKNTLIVGENGSGKSTILDALCFVLFGKAFRNINKPTLVNSINQKDCIVELDFTLGSKQYKIIRGIKPVVFEIYCNGVLVNQDSSFRDYQDYLEKYILKMNYRSFTQIVILGSASFIPFMQLSAADRRGIIEDLLDIQIFSTMNVIAKEELQRNKEDSESIRYSIKVLEERIKFIEQTLSSLKQNNEVKLEKFSEERDKLINEKLDLETQLENLEKDIVKLNEKFSLIDKKRDKHKKLIQLQSKLENNLAMHIANVDFYHDNDNCPTCKQIIKKTFKNSILKDTKKVVTELETALKTMDEKIATIVKEISVLDEFGKQIVEKNVLISRNKGILESLERNIERIDNEIEILTKADTLVAENEKNLQDSQKEKLATDNKLGEALTERQYIEMILNLLKDGGIKTKIIKQYLPIINKQINRYLAAMDFFVNFTINENFEEIIKSRFRDEFSYENFSEGEKMRIDLALLFTWRIVAKMKNSMNTNLLILDEVFDSSLDNNGTEEFMKILQTLTNNMNVFIISHKGDQLFDKFDKVIKFEKIKSFSRMIE